MEINFDPAKNASNIAKHGVSLSDAAGFEWKTAVVNEDMRQSYSEQRFEATGYIGARLHVLVFCFRADALRVISLRKANLREVSRYAKA